MPATAELPQFIGGPLCGRTCYSDMPFLVIKNPDITYSNFDYDKIKGGRENHISTVRLGGTYYYERQDRTGRVRYVNTKTE